MLVSGGYPEAYEKDKNITELKMFRILLYSMGTKIEGSEISLMGEEF